MPYCPTCRSEYREGFNLCADCDVPLVPELPPPAPATGVTEIYAGDHVTALMIESALEAAEIQTFSPDDALSSIVPYVSGAGTCFRVFVRDDDVAKAREILQGIHRVGADGADA